MTSDIRLKRVYEPAAAGDGVCVLVDRLWPRGLTRQQAAIDQWLRELAPSTTLPQWFGHDAARWQEFRRRYAAELRAQGAQLEVLLQRPKARTASAKSRATAAKRPRGTPRRSAPHG